MHLGPDPLPRLCRRSRALQRPLRGEWLGCKRDFPPNGGPRHEHACSVCCIFGVFFSRATSASASGKLWLHLLARVRCYHVVACWRLCLGSQRSCPVSFSKGIYQKSFHGLQFVWSMLLHASICIHCITITRSQLRNHLHCLSQTRSASCERHSWMQIRFCGANDGVQPRILSRPVRHCRDRLSHGLRIWITERLRRPFRACRPRQTHGSCQLTEPKTGRLATPLKTGGPMGSVCGR